MPLTSAPMLTLHNPADMRAYYASGIWQDETLYGAALRHAKAQPDSFAMQDARQRLTWAQVVARVDAIAARLAAQGLRQGDRIGVWLPNCVEIPLLLLACSRNGYICAPSLHQSHTVGEVVELMGRIGAQALVARPGWGADSDRNDIFAELSAKKTMRAVLTPSDADLPAGAVALPDRLQDPEGPAPSQDPDKVVYIAFTSGTTGMPKGVMHSDNTLQGNGRSIATDWGKDSPIERVFVISPLSHHIGTVALETSLACGAEYVVNAGPKGHSVLDAIIASQADMAFGVPTHAMDLMVEMQRRSIPKLGTIRTFYVAGATIPPSVCQKFLAIGVNPMNVYGMTENGSHNYTLPSDTPQTLTTTCGKACDGYEVRIWNAENTDVECAPGEIGEIGGRGGLLMLGYFDNQKATEKSFNASGWFLSGDLGRFDENGDLQILGRSKDLIIRGGHNIYPSQIEALALRHPQAEKVAAFPVPDERLGEKVCLAVISTEGQEIAAEAMLDWLDQAGLSKFDMPELYLPLRSFPLTPSGKVLKREMTEQVKAGITVPLAVRWTAKAPATA